MPNDSTRRNITETSEWTPGIYQLEENDVAEAGPDGILNQPIKDLAARTNYLKKLITELQPTGSTRRKRTTVSTIWSDLLPTHISRSK